MGAGMGRGGISCSAACCLLSLTPRHQDTKNCGMGARRIPGILGVFVANQSHGAPGGRALPGEDHGQGCPWHTGAAGHFSGARTFSPQRRRGAGRGPCACPLACGLGSPRSRGPCSRLGISPERGLVVRSGCGAHGAAHARAHWPAGLEARVPGEFPRAGMPVAPCGRLSMR